MEKSENRLVEIFQELRGLGFVTTQKEFAQLLGIHHTTLSNALAGRANSINPKLIATAEKARRNLLNGDPAPAPAPPREVTVSPDLLNIIATQAETIRSQQEVIARLTGVETKKGAV